MSGNTSTPAIRWAHFGDLHLTTEQSENYLDFEDLVDEVNDHLACEIDFVFLPGDNADDGTDEQYKLARHGLDRLAPPTHIIAGDHDRKPGKLDAFLKHLAPTAFRAVTLKGFRLLFLNALDGRTEKEFDLSAEQLVWVETELKAAREQGLRRLIFTHLYPSELKTAGTRLSSLIREFGVELVEMGHTHYNELANDGHTIYAVTRSTGQIEEGPPGFSITEVGESGVSWKFKERGEWPMVMITSPTDAQLMTRAEQVVSGQAVIRAKVFGNVKIDKVTVTVDHEAAHAMKLVDGYWQTDWDTTLIADGQHRITISAKTDAGTDASDEITALVNQSRDYRAPKRNIIDYENTIGAYPVKGIFGTELGPNEKGTKGPWPSWR